MRGSLKDEGGRMKDEICRDLLMNNVNKNNLMIRPLRSQRPRATAGG
jgi:hypothetical protein